MNPWRPNSPLSGMPLIKDGVRSKRESSYDRTGANRDFVRVETGETATLCDIEGCGCIKHIWLTTFCQAPQFLRKLVLEMYWDGETNPSVRTPLGPSGASASSAVAATVAVSCTGWCRWVLAE